uniref:receptor protein-tyrosine kinase n=1 Tax=Ciona savignyi TaxID=51511 RepID=H2YLJ5_CIOSA
MKGNGLCLVLLSVIIASVRADTYILYDTKSATSDLNWALHPQTYGWEELSGRDVNGNTIRYHQVCNVDEEEQDNWVRSPFIDARSAQRVYMDIEFSVMKCEECRETFALYYYQSSADIATSTFPPWRENPYTKIDTLAAGERFDSSTVGAEGINRKTLVISPLSRRGFYVAAQDQGACMSLMSLKLYYYYCPETTHNLAYFSRTLSGGEVASLVAQSGKCVSNSVYSNNEVPKYRCNSYGEWRVPTGSCHCRAGYQPNEELTTCQGCSVGSYKPENGNIQCQACPAHSLTRSVGADHCSCVDGYYRADGDSIHQACSRTPSQPKNITFTLNKTSVSMNWMEPVITGERSDIFYSVACQECESGYKNCRSCPSTIQPSPSNLHHLTTTNAQLNNLKPYSHYSIKVGLQYILFVIPQVGKPPAFQWVNISTSESGPPQIQRLRLVESGQTYFVVAWMSTPTPTTHLLEYQVRVFQNGHKIKDINVRMNCVVYFGLTKGSKYIAKVRVRNGMGYGKFSNDLYVATSSAKGRSTAGLNPAVIGGVMGVIAIVIIVIIVLFQETRGKHKSSQEQVSQCPRYLDPLIWRTYVDYRDPHNGVKEIATELDQTKIKIECVIGRGRWCLTVCRGKLISGKTSIPVAVKRLKEGASLIDHTNFLREACTMAQFDHPNIIQLKGVVTKSIPAMIITEFMENGSLDKFLQGKVNELTASRLLEMLRGIASGMNYLSSIKYIHRDLAARNILVSSDLVCKVSDFGLSRTLENDPQATYTTQGGKIALRWTAPECIRFRQFTSASDVWSYGIVMWEVMSYGEKPYWDMSNEVVTEVLEDGYRLPAPENCPVSIHNLMLKCWSYEAKRRPHPIEIIRTLDQFIKQPNLLLDTKSHDASAPLLNPDSPTSLNEVSTLDEWLDMVKLGKYRRSFHTNGINDLESLVHISESELDRLGITSPAHRTRLQGGISTLRQHLGEFPNTRQPQV